MWQEGGISAGTTTVSGWIRKPPSQQRSPLSLGEETKFREVNTVWSHVARIWVFTLVTLSTVVLAAFVVALVYSLPKIPCCWTFSCFWSLFLPCELGTFLLPGELCILPPVNHTHPARVMKAHRLCDWLGFSFCQDLLRQSCVLSETQEVASSSTSHHALYILNEISDSHLNSFPRRDLHLYSIKDRKKVGISIAYPGALGSLLYREHSVSILNSTIPGRRCCVDCQPVRFFTEVCTNLSGFWDSWLVPELGAALFFPLTPLCHETKAAASKPSKLPEL